ncbi:GTP-binding protein BRASSINAZOLE INSENSITIVE PALE GREEN 2, chloroplastic [Vicia villosa]|uniref:GTP-binding protein BRASSINAZOLE INSENSITIVE PALE GREEN 2, chloroplastic n=1 Tax=Vicia villosa TaxID=3911 RepID=UPI00273C1612|nr:GTP-binding protein BRASSINAZOLE INSENSITIVE PALE GREEN 2, chloroplastic [Vicia villosa]XP_058730231.1 GTP-binding protein BRASSINAZOLE INSENSITIVE PALE GREEN 2, chloroplastic [Vicia villosa]
MIVARHFSPSKLKPLFYLSLLSHCQNHSQSNHTLRKTLPHPSCNLLRYFSSQPEISASKQKLPFSREGNYDETTSQSLHVCPGCGVCMQDSNPKHPGYFIKPSEKDVNYKMYTHLEHVAAEPEFSNTVKKGFVVEPEKLDSISDADMVRKPEKPVVCARCHSLRHYGKVKDPTVENLLPDFDFDHTVGRKLASTSGNRSVVLMVVDAVDFDGSFPRKVAKLVSKTIEDNSSAWKQGKSGNVPRVILVVTKIDLLPSSLSPTRLEHWVRQRAREGGIIKITSLHMVSALRDWGLKNLVDDIVGLAGSRGSVWTVGAQNAGKSTLINSIGKHVGGKITHLTEAPVPGTTLGIVRVEGALPSQAKLFDTPGLLHPYQITTRLMREEQKLVYMTKELKPRTYRVKAGHSIHIAGLMRLDVEETSLDTIYVTVWASPYLPLHMGKVENATKMFQEHFGHQLQPPIGEKRVEELGNWVRREFHVGGNSWDSSSVDIAAAGLGWFAIGLKGEAVLGVWTYEGVHVVHRNSLIPYRSNTFEVTGFTVSKIVSQSDRASNKPRQQNDKKTKRIESKSLSSSVESPLLTSDGGI